MKIPVDPMVKVNRQRNALENMNPDEFTARPYQIDLYESSKQGNRIVCLDTGSGKTFISVMLIKHLQHQLKDSVSLDGLPTDKIISSMGKRTFFLVPVTPLVKQQADAIRAQCQLQVGEYHGMEFDSWTKDQWLQEMPKYQVFVMIHEIFRKVMQQGFLPWSKINLLIFDEVHHAVKNAPYREIMSYYDPAMIAPNEQPKILGLTASLIPSMAKPSKLEDLIKNLEKTMRCSVETYSGLRELNKYSAKPLEIKKYYDSFDPYKAFTDDPTQLKFAIEMARDCYNFLGDNSCCSSLNIPTLAVNVKTLRKSIEKTLYTLENMGIWSCHEIASIHCNELSELVEMVSSTRTLHASFMGAVNTSMKLITTVMSRILIQFPIKEQLFKFASPEMLLLLDILREYNGQSESLPNPEYVKNGLCGIIFVERRVIAHALSRWLQEVAKCDDDFGFLKVDFVVGSNASMKCGEAMTDKRQDEVLRKFRSHEYNLLVATSVLEEGLDVPRCNLVIRYDPLKNFREFVQSKGRARAEKGRFFVLIKDDPSIREEAENKLKTFKDCERIISENCHNRTEPTEEESESSFKDEEMIEPYMPNKSDGAARVTANSSIPIINRYCMKLPSDSFTKLVPFYRIEKCNDLFICKLRLPINSPIRYEIVNPKPMRSHKLAKKAVALEACKLLHIKGELDDNFIPIGKENIKFIEELGLIPSDDEDDVDKSGPRPGTTKRRQTYSKKIADVLKSGQPKEKVDCYLYVMDMKLTCAMPDDHNTRGRKINDPAQSSRNFGILTTAKVPSICSFPIFTRDGEVYVTIEPIAECLRLNQSQLEELAKFHQFTFDKVLRLKKHPLKFNPDNSHCSYFVVPVNIIDDNGLRDIDWQFVHSNEFQQWNSFWNQSVPITDNHDFKFERERFNDAVVWPWYRSDKPDAFYYVAEIKDDLHPKSVFPDETGRYKTFEQYFMDKYSQKIHNIEQPLLDVDHTSRRLNLLTSRHYDRRGNVLPTSTAKTKKEKRENLQQKQILVPELCLIHPFPATLWRKAVCLPSVLFRLNALLVSEQLRSKIALESGVGVVKPTISWPALNFGWTLSEILQRKKENEVAEVKVIKEKQTFMTWDMNNEEDADSDIDDEHSSNIKKTSESTSNHEDGLVIDEFDISKCPAFEDDDFDDDLIDDHSFIPCNLLNDSSRAQIRELNFGELIPENVQIIRPDSSCYDVLPVQNGKTWDFEEHADVPLITISPTGFSLLASNTTNVNLQGLSKDLQNFEAKVDQWDSQDDASDIEDLSSDMDEDEISDYNKRKNAASKGISNSKLNDFQLLRDSPKREKNVSSVLDSKEYKSLILDEPFQETNSESTSTAKTDNDMFNSNLAIEDKDYKEIKDAIKMVLEVDKEENTENERDYQAGNNGSAMENDIQEFKYSSDAYNDTQNNITDTLSHPSINFGELLPNRDEKLENQASKSAIKFDHYKTNEIDLGPSPSSILQALTMSNASDGFNLERLETVGDSFLKYAVTAFLYCVCPGEFHEGKLSFLRSKQISNAHLYKLGRKIKIGDFMNATKFDPNDNWCPPCFATCHDAGTSGVSNSITTFSDVDRARESNIPYDMLTQHSIPDKSIADCVEALIGAYLISSGPKGAILFMRWLGVKVMREDVLNEDPSDPIWHWLPTPESPLNIDHIEVPENCPLTNQQLAEKHLYMLYEGSNLGAFEKKLGYNFRDKAYLVQAFTHNSYYENQVTGCYQRLEFLGDAVLDYLITRFLYEDPRDHSPGTLTDLRSALVNNTFFASLAVKYEFQKHLKMLSHELFRVVNDFVRKFNEGRTYDCNLFISEGETENADDIEVPKALGDIFESVAGAIFLDSGRSLDAVWKVYYRMMKPEIEYFSTNVPKSPIRELLEMEPQNAKFGKPDLIVGKRIKVCVEVFDQGQYFGIGRNKRIAKCNAAKQALRALKKKRNDSRL